MFKPLQISPTDMVLSAYIFLAICNFLLSLNGDFGRPPFFPRALAAVRPAFVRSRMISRSNSASAPKIWKISFPPLVVVSMLSVRLLNPMFLE